MASDACCAAGQPVTLDYTPVGETKSIGDLDAYITGSGPVAVVLIYDIFGLNATQIFQVADRLAAYGFTVAVPDIFRGQPWSKTTFDGIREWMATAGSWEIAGKDVQTTVEWLKANKGAERFGVLGFCWGASIAMQCGADATFSAVGGAHPSLMGRDKEFAENVQCPVILLPAKGDPSFEPVQEILQHRPYGGKCVYQRFDEMNHGFCAARGDFSQPEIAAAATEAIKLMAGFFKDAMA